MKLGQELLWKPLMSNDVLQTKNVGLSFEEIAQRIPDHPALINGETSVSYSQLLALVHSFAVRLQDFDVDQESIIAVHTSDTIVSICTLLASSLIGCQYVVAGQALAASQVVKPTHFFKSPEMSGHKDVMFFSIDDRWAPAYQSRPHSRPSSIVSVDASWLLLHTSGTTGTPKYIALSQQMIFDRSKAVADDFRYLETRFASLFGTGKRPFFARCCAALLNGCTIVDSKDPRVWDKVGVTLVAGSPQQASGLLENNRFTQKFPLIEVSGAPLKDDLLEDLLDVFDMVHDAYGASETSKSFQTQKWRDTDGAIRVAGQMLDSDVEIISETGQICGEQQVGSVRIRNHYMIHSYFEAPSESESAFKDGWFYPGDFATWGEHAELRILGRHDDVINLAGNKVSAVMVDSVLQSVPGVKEAICFKNPKPNAPEQLLAFITMEPGVNEKNCLQSALAFCRTHLGPLYAPAALHKIKEIPAAKDARSLRDICAELVLDQAYLPNENK